MSYCLKTGGILHDVAYYTFHVCDLHIEGDCVIAVINEPIEPGAQAIDDNITLRVLNGESFRRRATESSTGVIVAKQNDCIATKYLQAHIARWYPNKVLRFGRD